MRAIVRTRYGPPEVLRLEQVAKPAPGPDDVLIRVHATTVTAGDCEARRFDISPLFWLPVRLFMGIFRPRIQVLGQELAGEIEAVGSNVARFKKGDQVVAPTTMRLGAHAEYICLPATSPMVTKPAGMSYAEAATMPVGGLNAVHFLNKARIRQGQSILINGAAGSIGTYAVQIAKSLGAHVTGVDGPSKLPMLRSIGADKVIDYTRDDFTTNGETYDVIFDIVGTCPYSRCADSLKKEGCYLAANPRLSEIVTGIWLSKRGGKRLVTGVASYKPEEFAYLKELIESRKVEVVIDRQYPLEDVPAAHKYVESGSKKGNVVITVGRDANA